MIGGITTQLLLPRRLHRMGRNLEAGKMQIECPHCQCAAEINESHYGRKARCPKCKGVFVIPEAQMPTVVLPPPVPQLHQPQPITIHAPTFHPPHEPRLHSSGWFARSFMSTTGVLLSIGLFMLVGVVAACGGCMYLAGNASRAFVEAEENAKREAESRVTIQSAAGSPATTMAHVGDVVRVGHVECRIHRGTIGRVALLDHGRPSHSEDEFLSLEVSVVNTSRTKRLRFTGWSHNYLRSTTVAALDEHGNAYTAPHFGFGTTVKNELGAQTIEPGGEALGIVVFEKPVDAAQTLTVELNGEAIDEDGTKLRWQLSRGDWK